MNEIPTAEEFVKKFMPYSRDWDIEKYALHNAKIIALICVDEIIKSNPCVIEVINSNGKQGWVGNSGCWQEFKLQIQNYEPT